MSNIKERNFNILRDKISGMTVVKIAEKYSLSSTSITNIINAQLSKVAEFDFNFERRIGGLLSSLESSEENARVISGKCQMLEKENSRLNKSIEKFKIDLLRAKSEIVFLKSQLEASELENSRLLVLKEEDVSKRHRKEYEKMKNSIAKFKS